MTGTPIPKRQKRAKQTVDDAVAEFGEDAVRQLVRMDNAGTRGLPYEVELALLRDAVAQRVLFTGDKITVEGAAVASISAKDRGMLLAAIRDLLAILRSNPDRFRRLAAFIHGEIP